MTHASAPSNAYTDAPALHPNLLLGSLQMLAWFFFHPAAWRHHVARIDPTLRADFCLLELHCSQWHNVTFQRLLVQGCLVWPCLVGCLVFVILGLMGMPGSNLVHGMVYGAVVGAATSGLGGMVVSLASGIVAGVLGGVLGGIAHGLMGEVAYGETLSEVASALASGVAGVALSVTAGIASQRGTSSWSRQLGSVVLGLCLAGLIASTVLMVVRSGASGVMATVATSGVIGGVACAAGWLRTRRWRCGVACGMAAAAVVGVAHSMATTGAVRGAAVILAGGAASVVCSSVFLLPYSLAGRMAGPWAGSVAGAIGGGSWLTFMLVDTGWFPVFTGAQTWRLFPYMLLGALIGLTHTLWRSVLTYPVQAAWSTLLYRLEEQRLRQGASLLRWQAVFWDEGQRLPLPFLDEHLVLVAERQPAEFQTAVTYVMTSHQRWAAQAAQVALDARRLLSCADVEDIRTASRHITAGELEAPASAVLRSLRRISQDVDAALHQASTYNQRLVLRAAEERLDGLLQELTRSGAWYAVRFGAVVASWRHIVAAHTQHMAMEAVSRQEIDSPYVLGVPLTPQQAIFVGRTDIGARIEQLLLDRRHPPLLLYGQRRMGKTSLLHHLGRLLPSTIVPLFVDMHGAVSRASDDASLLYNLARGMVTSARRQQGFVLPPLSRDALDTDPFTAFDEWLDGVEQALAPHTALLALDEFEVLEQAITTGRFTEIAVQGTLRHLIQHRPRFKVLLAGSHTPDELQHWASALINVQVVHISYLHETEARQLIERPVPDFALRYESEASQRVLALTRGHPALVQLLCAEIVAIKNEQPSPIRRLARLADVEAAVPRALHHGSLFFVDIAANRIDAAGRALLYTLAAYGAWAVVSRDVLATQCAHPIAQTLAHLTQRELIEAVAGGYRFQVELMRRWFAARGH